MTLQRVRGSQAKPSREAGTEKTGIQHPISPTTVNNQSTQVDCVIVEGATVQLHGESMPILNCYEPQTVGLMPYHFLAQHSIITVGWCAKLLCHYTVTQSLQGWLTCSDLHLAPTGQAAAELPPPPMSSPPRDDSSPHTSGAGMWGGGGIAGQQSAPHMHVRVCIRTNVPQISTYFHNQWTLACTTVKL